MNGLELVGQWSGSSIGKPAGRAVVEVELVKGEPLAVAQLFPSDTSIPPSVTEEFQLEPDGFSGKSIRTAAFSADFGVLLSDQQLRLVEAQHAPEVEASVSINSPTELELSWRTGIGTHGTAVLEKVVLPEFSRVDPVDSVGSWEDFRAQVSKQVFGDTIFRGQRKAFPLQTSFHRTNRKILQRYNDTDVEELHRSLSGVTDHFFDLEKPNQRGAFMNLAQHHGYPTPLLDWTLSPFVAAWFAYAGHASTPKKERAEFVRVFAIDRRLFDTFQQYKTITLAPPHVSILEPLRLENDRAGPQQAVLMLTNQHDIEGHIRNLEGIAGTSFLRAYDLPADEYVSVLNELAMMGITRSTLFPGIDSICHDQKEKWFG